jgi:hypothetical protein
VGAALGDADGKAETLVKPSHSIKTRFTMVVILLHHRLSRGVSDDGTDSTIVTWQG